MEHRRDGGRAALRRWAAGVLAALALGGCGGRVDGAGGVLGDVEWRERQVVFRLWAQPLRLEAYSIRGGVAPLGNVALALGCPEAMAFDAAGRVWVWGARGGVAVDGRSLRIVQQWQGTAVDVPRPAAAVALAQQGCEGGEGGVGLARAGTDAAF